jgi:hypothetical protein
MPKVMPSSTWIGTPMQPPIPHGLGGLALGQLGPDDLGDELLRAVDLGRVGQGVHDTGHDPDRHGDPARGERLGVGGDVGDDRGDGRAVTVDHRRGQRGPREPGAGSDPAQIPGGVQHPPAIRAAAGHCPHAQAEPLFEMVERGPGSRVELRVRGRVEHGPSLPRT